MCCCCCTKRNALVCRGVHHQIHKWLTSGAAPVVECFVNVFRMVTAFAEHIILETRDRVGKSDDSSSLGDSGVSLEYEDFFTL